MSAEGKERLYRIVVINERTGMKYDSGFSPCIHKEACVLKSKMNHERGWLRIQLEEVEQ